MKAEEMVSMWLRDKARELRASADSAERSYSEGSRIGTATRFVASKYRKAAVLLDDAATEIEDNPDMFGDGGGR